MLDRCCPLLDERLMSGFIVEGHRDLRPEHICFTDPITIFDCLEFNRQLRLVDVFDELAFLEVECALLGAKWLGPALRRRSRSCWPTGQPRICRVSIGFSAPYCARGFASRTCST
jgi:uncharacterized protein